MVDILVWPRAVLAPEVCRPVLSPFSRSGGKSLGGVSRVARTDLGHWRIAYENVAIHGASRSRAIGAIRSALAGRAGLIAVPVWSLYSAPWPDGQSEDGEIVLHSDGTSFSDGTAYLQAAITAEVVGDCAIGATTISIRVINGGDDISGCMFSHDHALYEIGRISSSSAGVFEVSVSPSIRAPISDGASLEFDEPTCLCRLDADDGIANGAQYVGCDKIGVSFVEATDYWSDLAAGLI